VSYGNSQPPDPDAPVAPPELIGASLLLGLVAVVGISTQGSFVIALAFGRGNFVLFTLLGLLVNVVGFIASLFYLALRRWAWITCIAYAAFELALRLYFALAYLAPGLVHPGVGGARQVVAAIGEVILAILLLMVLAYLSSSDTRGLIQAREAYRLRKSAGV
jgi:hypothetical protein